MEGQELSTNLIIQYILVGLIMLGAVAWMIWKLISARKYGAKSCCGCSLSNACGKKELKSNIRKDCCSSAGDSAKRTSGSSNHTNHVDMNASQNCCDSPKSCCDSTKRCSDKTS